MKKSLLILLILCVAASLFAASGFSVNVGGAFDLFRLKTDKADNSEIYYIFKGTGFGFDLGAQYDFNDKLMAYADFNMVFPSDFEDCHTNGKSSIPYYFSDIVKHYKNKADELINGKSTHMLFLLDASIGAAYKFDFDPVKLAVGCGAYVNLLKGSIHNTGRDLLEEVDEKYVVSFFTVGVSTLVEAKYMINDNLGIRLAVMPQVGIFSKRDIHYYYNGEDVDPRSLSGVGISFTMPVTIGASYSF